MFTRDKKSAEIHHGHGSPSDQSAGRQNKSRLFLLGSGQRVLQGKNPKYCRIKQIRPPRRKNLKFPYQIRLLYRKTLNMVFKSKLMRLSYSFSVPLSRFANWKGMKHKFLSTQPSLRNGQCAIGTEFTATTIGAFPELPIPPRIHMEPWSWKFQGEIHRDHCQSKQSLLGTNPEKILSQKKEHFLFFECNPIIHYRGSPCIISCRI